MEGLWMLPDRQLGLGLLPIFLVCVCALMIVRLRNTRGNFPPGPLALPVVGHLHLLGKFPHRSLHELSTVYGPLMGLRLGSIPVIVASSPDMAAQILQKHDLLFASRPRVAASRYLASDCADITFAHYGPYLRCMQQICARTIFSNEMLNTSVRLVRAEEVALLLRSVFEDSEMGREVTVLSKFLSVANNIVSRMVFRKTFTELVDTGCQDSSGSFLDALTEAAHLAGAFNVGDYIPYLEWMDLQGYGRQMKIVSKKIDTILQDIVDARRKLRTAEYPGSRDEDLLDALLSFYEEPRNELQITDGNIRAVLLDMYAAGTDTSAVATEWALSEMLRNPESMKKAQEELDIAVGNERCVQESDIAHLPYLQAVVKETMRLHPAVPLMIPHESTESCKIAGYVIPAKTRAFVNVWAIGRDPKAWERPLEFWPERFLKSNVDVQGQHFQLLPFGSGRRKCRGNAQD